MGVAYKWRSEVTPFVLKESKSMKVKIRDNNFLNHIIGVKRHTDRKISEWKSRGIKRHTDR